MAKKTLPEIPGLFDDLPEDTPKEQIAKITLKGWRDHLASFTALERKIEGLLDDAVKQTLAKGGKLTQDDIGRVFQRHPEMRRDLEKAMQTLNKRLTATIEEGSKEAWLRANATGNEVALALAANNAQLAALLASGQDKPQNDRALRAFMKRKEAGMNLSDRVWKTTMGMKLDMERAIDVALAEGMSADRLSLKIRKLLREPNRLYRRVRDKDGILRLSQAAQKYHPGTGVYRSSYKNAMRVARTEANMAYQASDNERWKKSWWIRGIRVSLSNNHTTTNSKGEKEPLIDICDELRGDYPPDFNFIGWHPQCRCFATAITVDYDEIRDYYRRKRAGEDMSNYKPKGLITDVPMQFKNWMERNADRLAGAAERGTTPYFIKENPKYTDPGWKPAAPPKPTIQQRMDERHAKRTPADIEKIQFRSNVRQAEIATQSPLLSASHKSQLQSILNDKSLTPAQRNDKLVIVTSDIGWETGQHTIVRAASRYAKESPVIAELAAKWANAGNPIYGLNLQNQLKEKCAIKTRWDLKKWEAVPPDKMTFHGIEANYQIYKGGTLTTRYGDKVKTNDLTQDLLEFRDQHGVKFYYPIGIQKTEIRYKAIEVSEFIEKQPRYIRENLKNGIIFSDKDHPLDKFYQKEYRDFTKGAMYSGDPVTVHSDYTKNPDGFKFSICHEIGHHIDVKIGWRHATISQDEWKNAQKADKNFYRDYGKNSPVEDFADTVSLYVTKGKEWLKKNHPHRAALIEKILADL